MLKNFLLLFLCFIVLSLSVRGLHGSPSPEQLNTSQWKEEGPFELSPERGRFALIYSLVEENSFHYSIPLARFVTPDLGYWNGNYVSLLAPGVSLIAIPGYVVGKALGMAQIGAFAVVSIFSLLNFYLVASISRRLGQILKQQ